MTLWDLCIKRPVFTVMLVSAPIVLGAMAYKRLGVDLLPNVELPIVSVTTTLRGTSVEEMETKVTKPIEEIINTVSSIDELRSTTKEGISQITVTFLIEKNRDVAAQEVRDKVSTILSKLPPGTDPPIIDKFDLNAMPVLNIAVSGDRPMQELTEIARKQIKENLEGLSGVGAVILVGGRQRAINVYIDTDKLSSYNLSIENVRQAIMRQNLELPGGRVDQGSRELVLRTMGRIENPQGFLNLIVDNKGANGYPIRIKDIGRIEDSFEEPRGLARLDGKNAISLIIQKQSGANSVAVVETVKNRLEELKKILPKDIDTFIVKDQSIFIVNSFEELQFHLVVAAILVAITIMMFIRDWRTTVIASLAIPASIITTFAFMTYMHYTLNNMTMLGLILAIGIVIDDAVVINENIFRHMEEDGVSALVAASRATKEIALAVMATTLSLLVIFMPIVFMGGKIGLFFSSFGATVAFSIFMSLFISFTLTPMLCALFLKLKKDHGSKSGPIWNAIDGSYGWILAWSLRHRWAIVICSLAFLGVTPLLFKVVGFEFLPRDDQSELEVAIIMPEGCSLDRADKLFGELEGKLKTLRGAEHVFTTIGDTTGRMTRGQGDVTNGTIYIRLTDLKHRQRPWYDLVYWWNAIRGVRENNETYFTQFDIQDDARRIMKDYPDLRVAVQDVSLMAGSGMRQAMIDLNLLGPDLGKLQKYSNTIIKWMKEQVDPNTNQPYFVDVDNSLSLRKPELQVRPDRERASDLGIPIQTLASTLNVLVGGEPVSSYKELDEQYDVWLRADLPFRETSETIGRLMIPSPKAGLVQLNNVARLEPAKGPATIDRFRMQRQVVITSNLENLPTGDAVEKISSFIKTLDLPPDYPWEFIGKAKTLKESNENFLIAFIVSFIFMYMILAAQFESFIHPITILLALPLTLPFAIISLLLLRTSLDLYAMFGLFMLFGIVKKNGILQVDYTNVLRQRGLERNAAILEANHTRLRPILMTTVMLIAAMIPIAIGRGPGAGSRASLAKVVLGGQTLSLLLTLLVTPVAYSLWDDFAQWTGRLFGRKKQSEEFPSSENPTGLSGQGSDSLPSGQE